jgi:thiazole synthase
LAKVNAASIGLDAMSVEIRVNGEQRRVPTGISVAEMLMEIGLDPKKVAVERNLEIVPRSKLGEVPVGNGDAYEIVHFVGGG